MDVHVEPHPFADAWSVIAYGARVATFERRDQANAYARDYAARAGLDVVERTRNGGGILRNTRIP